jgi:5-formyltetrahydrofolate cyclo-ligase
MPSLLLESKRKLRGEMSRRRREVSPAVAAQAAKAAAESLATTEVVRRARRIALYAALPGELPTRPLFDAVLKGGATVLFPRTVASVGLEFSPVQHWEELRAGCFGVLEPPVGAAVSTLSDEDLVIVPGLAFDETGHRVGHGKGYYDRAFPEASSNSPTLLGFGYEFQVVDSVPYDELDRRLDGIVTEQTIRDCTGCLR